MIVSSQVRRDDRADVDVQGLPRARRRRRALRRGHRSGHRRSSSSPREHGFRQRLPRRPGHRRPLQRAVRRSGSSRPRVAGIDIAGGARLRDRRRRGVPRRRSGNAGLWLGCALGELARQGRDKLTFVADAPLDSYGIWAEQLCRRVDRQARPRHPADRRRAAARARAPTATTACSCTSRSATRDNAAKLAALKDAGHPVITIRALGPDRPRPDLLPVASSRSPSPAGCWRSTRSTSPTSKRPRTTPTGCSRRVPPDLDDGQPERADRRAGAAALLRDHGLPAVLRRDRGRGRARCARR